LINVVASANAGDDSLTISNSSLVSSTIYGGAGNDTLVLNATGGLFYGDAGDDSLRATTLNAATIYGDNASSSGSDTFNFTTATASLIYGQQGNDSFTGAYLTSTIYGGQGNDTFTLATTSRESKVHMDQGDDLFTAGTAVIVGNTITGGNGTDTIQLSASGVSVLGGSGADSIVYSNNLSGANFKGSLGTYFFGFGSGQDTIRFSNLGVTGAGELSTLTFAIDAAYGSTGVISGSSLVLGADTVSFSAASGTINLGSGTTSGIQVLFVTVSSSTITSLG